MATSSCILELPYVHKKVSSFPSQIVPYASSLLFCRVFSWLWGSLTASLHAPPCPPKAHGHTHGGLSARDVLVPERCREAAFLVTTAFLPLPHRSLCCTACGTHTGAAARAPSPVLPCPFLPVLWATEDSKSLVVSPMEKRGSLLKAITDVSPTLLKAVIFPSRPRINIPTPAGRGASRSSGESWCCKACQTRGQREGG